MKRKMIAVMLGVSMMFAGSVHAAQITVGGQVPLIAEVIGMGFSSLDFSGDGTDQKVGHLIVSCNAPDFTVDFAMENSGDFDRVGGNGSITPAKLEADAAGTGTLGTGAANIANENLIGATAQWAPGTQSTATYDYGIDLIASWTADKDNLAGFYREKITVTIVPSL